MSDSKSLETFKARVEDAIVEASLYIRLNEEEAILSEARRYLTRSDFQELEKYAFENLVKRVNIN